MGGVRGGGALGLMVLLAGCIGPGQGSLQPAPLDGQSAPWTVVALVDTGINPWHEAFQLPDGNAPPLPAPATTVPATFRESLQERGKSAWNDLERGELYWFEGTRVLAISMTERIPPGFAFLEQVFPSDPHAIYDDTNHGTAASSIVAEAAQHAWIVMVETSQLTLPGYAWASEQAWIDIAATSLLNLAHGPNNLTQDRDAWADATHRIVANGALFVSAGGNEPSPNLLEGRTGPPWVISVGGAEGARRGITPLTAQPVEVVADFTRHGLARNNSDTETFSAGGTSFGAPLVAGVLAEALYQVRSTLGHRPGTSGVLVDAPSGRLTNADFRHALNLTAEYWAPTEHQPSPTTSSPLGLAYSVTTPALPHAPGTPIGPWVQMGWGYVHEGTAQRIADLLLGRIPAPDKADAVAYMEQVRQAREAAWDLRQRP
jgi:hypothetical protein